ncbi:MAG: putative Serine/Threonine kinase domain protein, partial [Streblomastix strix]
MKKMNVRDKKVLCCKYAFQVLTGLNFIHSLNIIHRDLKPENILIDNCGNAKIADYGLVLRISRPSYSASAGTKTYNSPEMHNNGKITTKTDIFSLGIIIAEMLTGHNPFAGKTDEDTIANIKI